MFGELPHDCPLFVKASASGMVRVVLDFMIFSVCTVTAVELGDYFNEVAVNVLM